MKGTSKKKATKGFHMKFSEDEHELFKRKVEERGTTATDFIKERIFNDNFNKLHNVDVERAIHNVSDLLINGVAEHCTDEVFQKKCKEGVKNLWQSLK